MWALLSRFRRRIFPILSGFLAMLMVTAAKADELRAAMEKTTDTDEDLMVDERVSREAGCKIGALSL